MFEKRKQVRRHFRSNLRVYQGSTNLVVGQVVDITKDGFMLLCERHISPDLQLHLCLNLPRVVNGKRVLSFLASTVWSKEDKINPGYFNVGFRFLGLSQSEARIIEELIEFMALRIAS